MDRNKKRNFEACIRVNESHRHDFLTAIAVVFFFGVYFGKVRERERECVE